MHESYFHQVIALHEIKNLEWEQLTKETPHMPRGWYELSQLPTGDRIEFTRDYWLSKLGDKTSWAESQIKNFFKNLEEIGFYITQYKQNDSWDVHMVYSLKGVPHFLHGSPPASEARIEGLRRGFDPFILPSDYLVFLQIHDGFSKYTDTGLIKTREIARIYRQFQRLVAQEGLVSYGRVMSREAVIPFYESSRLHCYQCFRTDQYSDEGIGNAPFFEGNFLDREKSHNFPSFLNWLMFYLENN